MDKTKVIVLGIFAMVSALYADGTWTLEACLKQAKQKSLSLESAKLREQKADISIKLATAITFICVCTVIHAIPAVP